MSLEHFASRQVGDINMIAMPMVVDHKNIDQFESAKIGWLKSTCLVHVMDHSQVVAIMPSSHKNFVQFHRELRDQDKSLFSINVSEALMPRFKQDGLISIFNPVETLEIVYRIIELKKAKRDETRSRIWAELINSLTTSTQDFLKLKMGLESVSQTPFMKESASSNTSQIAGQLSVDYEAFEFSSLIRFEKNVFEKLFEYWEAQNSPEQKTEKLASDLRFELAAQKIFEPIFNSSKKLLSEKKAFVYNQTHPQILLGSECHIHDAIPVIVVSFQTSIGTFSIEVGIKN